MAMQRMDPLAVSQWERRAAKPCGHPDEAEGLEGSRRSFQERATQDGAGKEGCTLALGLDCHFRGCEAPSDGPLCQAGLPLWSQPPKTKDTPKPLAS